MKETDAFGRERSVELNNDGYGYEFDVEWHYDTANGFLESIQTGPGGSATLQNLGYEWDKVGNLEVRTDLNQSVTEEFFYDGLNRLDTVQLNSVQTLNVNYNASGRITYKSDVGTYQYNDDPHSVSDITGTRPGSYDYDANGNMTNRDGDTITWYPFNKPERINYGSDYVKFWYGADHSRYKQEVKEGAVTRTIRYAGGLFEKEYTGSSVEHRHFIVANGRAIAIVTRPNTGAATTEYLLRDHQDNVVEVVDFQGNSLQPLSYDAFGKRRNANWTADTADNRFADTHETERGYTGHEHLDNVRLIHMNGRVQDPIIGQMISSDPFVAFPSNGQSFNRYSYVMNNPATLMDPTGFQADDTYDWDTCVISCDPRIWYPYWEEHRGIWVPPRRSFGRLDPNFIETTDVVDEELIASSSQTEESILDETSASGAGLGVGTLLERTAALRAEYASQAAALDPQDVEGREALKKEIRGRLNALGRAITKSIVENRARRGHVQRQTNATRSNVTWNKVGKAFRYAGRALQAGALAAEVYNISTAPDGQHAEVAAQAGGRLAGGLGGAYGGAQLGALGGPLTAIGGAVIGGIAGSIVGDMIVSEMLDND